MPQFPHLKDSGAFPEAGRELYTQIEGSFDYSLWQEGAKITLMSVPWGVFQAGIMTDRPGFDTAEERDTWFLNHIESSDVESHVLDTRVRYQMDDYIDVPFTFDYAARYNYLMIEYQEAPLAYGASGLRKWFYHITDIQYGSPSSTTLLLVPDWWTTAAPLMDITHMILERGHAPMTLTDVDTYLEAPLSNSESLLTPDVDFGTRARKVRSTKNEVFNDGTVYAVCCLSGVVITGSFSNYAALPFDVSTIVQGVPSDYQFAVEASSLEAFLDAWASNAPQSMQALDAMYLCGEKLLTFASSVTLWGFTVLTGAEGASYTSELELSRQSFGYDARFADLAKLYTYPYAHIEIADEQGSVTELHIEDLDTGTVTIEAVLNGAFPWLTVSAHVAGVSGSRSILEFSTTEEHEFTAGGLWWETLRSWKVPCFSVHQSNAQAYDYRTHWSRVQQANNASTAKTNVLASNATAKTNADNAADNLVANNLVNTTANSNATSTSNSYALESVTSANKKVGTDVQTDNAMTDAVTGLNNEVIGLTSALNQATSAARTVVNVATNPIETLNAAGAVADMAVDIVSAQAATAISQSSNRALATLTQNNNLQKGITALTYASEVYGIQTDAATDLTNIRNQAATTTASNNSSLTKTNATNTKTTGDANANRSYDNAMAAITNAINEAGLQAPLTFGIAGNGDFTNTRPNMLSINVVTESDNAIMQAGTQFLRYGYAYNAAWDWSTWNEREKFTYWQVSDIWATGVNTVPEEAQDAVRRMLYDGVTCWTDPDDIGKVNIYG